MGQGQRLVERQVAAASVACVGLAYKYFAVCLLNAMEKAVFIIGGVQKKCDEYVDKRAA